MSIWPEKHILEGQSGLKFYNLEQALYMALMCSCGKKLKT